MAQMRRRRGGFTLAELMVAMSVFALLTLGVISLFITMLRLCGSVQGATSASLDAANAVGRVTNSLREARTFTLMDGGAFGTTYDAIDANGIYVAVTGIRISFPAPVTTVAVTTPSTAAVALSGSDALWNRKGAGQTLDFYRANLDGTPNPRTGVCLWASGTENGQPVNGPVIKSIAPTLDAVQFIQPNMPDGVTPLANEVKVKITSAYYDPARGYTSSDSATQVTTELTGECIYLRDHSPTGATSTGAHGQRQN